MSTQEYRFKPRRSTSLCSKHRKASKSVGDEKSPHHHHYDHAVDRHHHEHGHAHHHHHDDGEGHRLRGFIEWRSVSESASASSETSSRRSPSSTTPVKSAIWSQADVASEPISDTRSPTPIQRCRLCCKVRELRHHSANLTKRTEASDVIVKTSDGKKFYCHSFVLDAWAPHLLAANQSTDPQKRGFEIEVKDFSGSVVNACLRLMYGGNADTVPLDQVDEILKLADAYNVRELKEACMRAASAAPLTPGKACSVWQFAKVHRLDQLEQRAMRFVFGNLPAITADFEGRAAWNDMVKKPEMLLDLFFAVAEWTSPKIEPIRVRDTQLDDLWQKSNGLRESFGYPDTAVQTKDGTIFYVHLPFLALTAPEFAKWINERADSNGSTSIDDFDGDVVEEFLRGIYRQAPGPAFPELADYVYSMAKLYKAEALTEACERQMANNQLHDVDSAVKLVLEADEHRMPVVRSVCFRYFFENARQLRLDENWMKMALLNPPLIARMIAKWQDCRQLKQA